MVERESDDNVVDIWMYFAAASHGGNKVMLTHLLSNKKTIIPLINYINATERFSGQDDHHQAFPRPNTQAQGQDQDRSSEPNH
jgi:hypothetical protein